MTNVSVSASAKIGGLRTFFANMKVKTKVLLGFAMVLLLLATVAGVSYFGFNGISGQFGQYSDAVTIASDSGGIERDLVKLRRDIDNYVGTRNAQAAKDALAREADLRKRIGQLEVVTVETGGDWQRVFVKTGRVIGEKVEVLSGLQGHEEVVLEGEGDAR